MILNKLLRNQIKKLSNSLVIQRDLYTQVSESRDLWKSREQRAIGLVKTTQNKLRDEEELCDQLLSYIEHIVRNYKQFLVQEDINRGKLLSQIHKEARHVK